MLFRPAPVRSFAGGCERENRAFRGFIKLAFYAALTQAEVLILPFGEIDSRRQVYTDHMSVYY